MTYREFYSAVSTSEFADADLRAFANEAIKALDHKNELRKARPSKADAEVVARREAVLNVLTEDTFVNRDEVAALAGVTPGQATAALTYYVKAGLVTRVEGKGKTKTAYCLASAE